MMQRIVVWLLIVSLLTFNSGCSFFVSKTQMLTVTATEEDAEIYIDGELLGKGSVKKVVPRNKCVSIMAKREGFVTQTRYVGRRLGTVGIVDTIGAWLIILPAFGLLSAGAWELDKDHVMIVMSEEE